MMCSGPINELIKGRVRIGRSRKGDAVEKDRREGREEDGAIEGREY